MLELSIPGNPAPWTVYVKKGPPPIGFERMVAWQAQIQLHLHKAWGNQDPLSGPVVLDATFFLPWPNSAPQRRAEAIERWYWEHRIKKPDGSNYFKAFEDACEDILFHNDSQVVRWKGEKDILRPTVYNQVKEGYTIIRFKPLERK